MICIATTQVRHQPVELSTPLSGLTFSFLDGDEAARRCTALFDQQRKDDHLHPRLRDFVAIDEAFATCDRFPDQRAIAARMRAAMPVSAEVKHAFPCLGGRPGLRSEEHTSELQLLAYLVCRL